MPRSTPQYFIDPSEVGTIDAIDAQRLGYDLLAAMNEQDVFVREIAANKVLRQAAQLIGDNLSKGAALPAAYRRGTHGVSPFGPTRTLSMRRTPSGLTLRIRRTY